MIQRRSFVLASSFVLVSAFAEEPSFTNFRFGIVRPISENVFEFERLTTQIPRRFKNTGFRFGVGFDNPQCVPIEWYEVVQLPEELKDVSGNFQRNRSKTMRTKTFTSAQPSVVDDFWFDEGDPLGKHTLELYVNGALRYKVDFEVVEDK